METSIERKQMEWFFELRMESTWSAKEVLWGWCSEYTSSSLFDWSAGKNQENEQSEAKKKNEIVTLKLQGWIGKMAKGFDLRNGLMYMRRNWDSGRKVVKQSSIFVLAFACFACRADTSWEIRGFMLEDAKL